jgi:unsaturated rhamnogalacturonyl hydrolase
MRSFLALFLAVLSMPAFGREPYLDKWKSVADKLISTPVESYPFNWGEGVQMIGLMKVQERTRQTAYLDYLEKWAAQFPPGQVTRILADGIPKVSTRPGYCGHWSPGTAIQYLNQARPAAARGEVVRLVFDYIQKTGERSPEGALGHWQGSHQLWVDTLYMACPLLTALGQPGDSARQVLLYAKHLQDERSGLFYHMWDWQTGKRSPDLWGRGNGWVLMSIADTFDKLPKSDPQYAELMAVAVRMAKGLRATQDAAGVWHTVLDEKGTYTECSATSMFVYGLLKLVRLGVLPKSEREPALRAWRAVNEQYIRDGVVVGVSAGTDPGNKAHYQARPLGVQTWGTGAYLMAGSEVARR